MSQDHHFITQGEEKQASSQIFKDVAVCPLFTIAAPQGDYGLGIERGGWGHLSQVAQLNGSKGCSFPGILEGMGE